MSAPPPAGGSTATEWEGHPVEEWRVSWGLPRLLIYPALGSTNDAARQLAQEDAPAGTTVLADHQSSGRGQRGRSWIAPPGTAVLVSVLLRPALSGEEAIASVLPVRVGLAVARALEQVTGLTLSLKWPNDLLVGEAKIGGVLCEGVLAADGFHAVAGVGVNVLQQAGDFPPALDPPAASLRMLGVSADRPSVAGAVARAVAGLGDDAARLLEPAELREYQDRDILRGRRVTIDGVPAGTADGLTPDGALVLASDTGPVHVRSGTVRPEPRSRA